MSKKTTLQIKNLHASIDNVKILNGVSLDVSSGEVHVIMGQNGSGKSTLLSVLMGHPRYDVTAGTVTLDKKNILKMSPDERAHVGLFLGFQHPQVVAGVSYGNFLRTARNTVATARDKKSAVISPMDFSKAMKEEMIRLKIDPVFISRSVNEGFSGGEKKKSEVLQMAMLEPTIAFLDEIDSGLDIDALKIVAKELVALHKKQKMALVVVSHNPKLIALLSPTKVHVMSKGKIVKSGGKDLVKKIEKGGYDAFLKK
ncbi:MAG: Fe-S cluster assembly ATPase SufC [Candidatus Magasanikbacteria bacterium]|nr:Fe-S cluster assembly ATPase SufC [Candidatus Magasanikbacteria bacterium]